MLSLLVAWLILTPAALAIGYRIIHAAVPASETAAGRDWDYPAIWLGLLATADLLLPLAAAGPLTPGRSAVTLLAAAGIGLLHAPTRARARRFLAKPADWRGAAATAAVCAAAAAVAALPAYRFDTGLYHYPHITWLAEFGEVPGLALLNNRFALVSSWFTLSASFDHGFLAGRSATLVNGFAFALFARQIIGAARRWRAGGAERADRFLAVAGGVVALYALATGFVNSPSPDVPGLFVPVIMGWAVLRGGRGTALPVAALLAILLLAVKPSGLPTVAVAAAYLLYRRPWRDAVAWAAAAALVLAPPAVAGIAASGCFAFPVGATCLDLPWGLDAGAAQAFAAQATEWARWAGRKPADTDWASWWAHWSAARSNLALLLLLVLSAAAGATLWRRIRADAGSAFVAALAAAGCCYVVTLAPSLRFAASDLVLLPALFMADRETQAGRAERVRFTVALTTATAVIVTGAAFAIVFSTSATLPGERSILSALIVPPSLAERPQLYFSWQATESGLRYRLPDIGEQCWDIPLPCAPKRLAPNVALREPEAGLAGGFTRR